MSFPFFAILLALTWVAITGSFSFANLILGGILGLLALWFIRLQVGRPNFFSKFPKIIALIGLFLYELMLSSVKVLFLVLSPHLDEKLQPAIIAFPLKVKTDIEITALANLITLTPGTLSVDVSKDHSVLYVHVISMLDKNAMIKDIATGFEAKIIEVFA